VRGESRRFRIPLALGIGLLIGLASAPAPAAAASDVFTTPMSTGGVNIRADQSPQDANRLAMKRQGLLRWNPRTRHIETANSTDATTFQAQQLTAAAVSSGILYTGETQYFMEPLGGNVSSSEKDDAGVHYADINYWRFCVAGAGAVAADTYAVPTDPYYAGHYTETYGRHQESTYWNATDTDAYGQFPTKGRAYIMYLAESVQPQNPQSKNFNSYVWDPTTQKYDILKNMPGIMNFTPYPTTGSDLGVLTDALNWEMSGHNRLGPWPGYFFDHVTSFSQALLHADVVNDIVNNYMPVIVTLDARNLIYNSSTGYGNWANPGQQINHAIAIVGFDDVHGTYQYIDTCGHNCSGGLNGGVHTLPQTAMYSAVHSLGGGYIA
jgi:hypothetical protein